MFPDAFRNLISRFLHGKKAVGMGWLTLIFFVLIATALLWFSWHHPSHRSAAFAASTLLLLYVFFTRLKADPAPIWSSWPVQTLAALLLAFLIALHLEFYIFSLFTVENRSMEPGFPPDTRIVVEKLGMGILIPGGDGRRLPFTAVRPVHRGDVVVIRSPNEPGLLLLKRVIAIGGDRVAMENGRVTLNNQLLSEDYVSNKESSFFGAANRPDLQIPPAIKKYGEIAEKAFLYGVSSPVTVPQGMIFVMGDNRPHSRDSRTFGFVPEQYLLGRAILSFRP